MARQSVWFGSGKVDRVAEILEATDGHTAKWVASRSDEACHEFVAEDRLPPVRIACPWAACVFDRHRCWADTTETAVFLFRGVPVNGGEILERRGGVKLEHDAGRAGCGRTTATGLR